MGYVDANLAQKKSPKLVCLFRFDRPMLTIWYFHQAARYITVRSKARPSARCGEFPGQNYGHGDGQAARCATVSTSCSLLRLQTSSGDRKSVQTLRALQTLLWKKPCSFFQICNVWKFDTTKLYGYLNYLNLTIPFLQYAIAGHPQIIECCCFLIFHVASSLI